MENLPRPSNVWTFSPLSTLNWLRFPEDDPVTMCFESGENLAVHASAAPTSMIFCCLSCSKSQILIWLSNDVETATKVLCGSGNDSGLNNNVVLEQLGSTGSSMYLDFTCSFDVGIDRVDSEVVSSQCSLQFTVLCVPMSKSDTHVQPLVKTFLPAFVSFLLNSSSLPLTRRGQCCQESRSQAGSWTTMTRSRCHPRGLN